MLSRSTTLVVTALYGVVGLTGVALAQSRHDGRAGAKRVDPKIEQLLKEELDAVRSGQPSMRSGELAAAIGTDGLYALPRYLYDESTNVRGKVAAVAGLLGIDAKNADRKFAGRLLVDFVIDEDKYVARVAMRGLEHFRSVDFDGEARYAVVAAVKGERPTPALLLACGVVGANAAIPRLKEIHAAWLESGTTSRLHGRGFDTELALARLGEQEQRKLALARVVAITDIYERAKVMNDLQYIRHLDAIAIIVEVLRSDAPYRNPGDATELAPAQIAAVALSRMLADFPVPQRIGSFTPEELNRIRAWTENRTEWQIRR